MVTSSPRWGSAHGAALPPGQAAAPSRDRGGAWSRVVLEAGGSVFPMMGECVVSRAALEAGSSVFP